jgi:hypothetical protein
MSQINIPVTQLAQLGFADRIAHEAQGHPEVARQVLQQAMPEVLKQQKDSIVATQDSEAARKLKAEKDGRDGKQGDSGAKGQRQGEPPPEEAESVPNTPWAGNILNLKV